MSETKRITRREFIKGTALSTAAVSLLGDRAFRATVQATKRPPNIVFIHTDQQHFEALSGLGNKYLRTPNMDRLLRRGTSFSLSYSANPVCCPARSCWYTGRPSSENGMLSNNHKLSPDVPDLGQWFSSRGYECFYSGKWHIRGRDPAKSFNTLTADPSGQGELTDPVVSRSAQAFLHSYDESRPFFLSLGFLQPHDCCYWVFAHNEDIGSLPYPSIERDLPPLPPNFDYPAQEPPSLVKHLTNVRNWTKKWSELHHRYYEWSYYRHVEMVDAELGRALDALEDSKFAENTLIVFTADHGDCLSRRKLVQKWTPYDEALRVPLIVVPPDGPGSGRIDRTHIASGLDIAPTLCDYAGIAAPPKARGRSLRPLVEGRETEWREFAVSECLTTGRVLITPEYKFVSFEGEQPLQLFDLRTDPWEMRNLASEARHADTVRDLSTRLRSWEKSLEVAPAS